MKGMRRNFGTIAKIESPIFYLVVKTWNENVSFDLRQGGFMKFFPILVKRLIKFNDTHGPHVLNDRIFVEIPGKDLENLFVEFLRFRA